MRYLLAITLLVFIAVVSISCEAYKLISVTVFDQATKKPLDSVFIEVNAGKNGDYKKSYTYGYTDSTGKFETHLMIGCAFGCYDIYLEYNKKGYKHKSEFNRTEGVVELEKK